ncbi:MAG: YgiW/YdeI family stress tolerance OB fold protein [Succinivibrio sp.]
MKSSVAIAAFCAAMALFSTQALAGGHEHEHDRCALSGGFTGEVAVTSIKDAMALKDDDKVVVEAKILKQTGKKTYVIADASGQAEAKISQRDFCGQSVGPEDPVRIFGEIDQKNGKNVIDADYLVMLSKK